MALAKPRSRNPAAKRSLGIWPEGCEKAPRRPSHPYAIFVSRANNSNMECTIRSMRAARNQVSAVFAILAQASATIPLSAYPRYGELTDSGGETADAGSANLPALAPLSDDTFLSAERADRRQLYRANR
jgi:hypothetical protein